jgi:hypothetical protein
MRLMAGENNEISGVAPILGMPSALGICATPCEILF